MLLISELSAYEIEYSHHLKYIEQFNITEIPKEIENIKSSEKTLELSLFIEIGEEEYKKKNKLFKIIQKILEFLCIKKFKTTVIEELLKKYSKECLIALYQQKF